MKRRQFLAGTAAVAVAGALPAIAAAASSRGPLLDDPGAWVGTEFSLADGSRLRLERVEHLERDRHSIQARLQFRAVAGHAPGEGLHRLATHGLGPHELYLQPGHDGPVACLNRLRGVA